jgi:hypothetical protein
MEFGVQPAFCLADTAGNAPLFKQAGCGAVGFEVCGVDPQLF